jgi:tripartite-type tricarboxylate transporter receptor subunit TctC
MARAIAAPFVREEMQTMPLRYPVTSMSLLLAMSAFATVHAQPYPHKPVRLIIPSPAGGGTDTLARVLREGLAENLQQPIVVDNRGGASGRIAAAMAAKATPDGHTLFFTYGGVLTTGLPLFGKLPYHPIDDFAPVAMVAHVPGLLVAHPSFPARTVAGLIKLAKAKPGGLTHGTSSIGSSSHLNMELFKQMAGIEMLQVSYPGDNPALAALIGGHVPFAFNNVVAAQPHLQSGRLVPIAVATAERVPNLPDVPTVAESGLPGYEGLLFYALVAPAGTPAAIVQRLNNEVTQVKKTPAVRQRLERLGAIPLDMKPAELRTFLQRELDKWTRVIRGGNIKPE